MSRPSRVERIRAWRRQTMLVGWLIASGVIVGRSAYLQVVDASTWREAALNQHRETVEVAAPRGVIFDRNGVTLAESREVVTVHIAPEQMADREALRGRLETVLGLSESTSRRVTDPSDPWHPVPGRYAPSVANVLAGTGGVHLTTRFERTYPHGDLARGVIGVLREGVGVGGIERLYEDALAGTPGSQIVGRDSRRRRVAGEVFTVSEPQSGGEVHLTIDIGLQEIAQQALSEAVDREGAEGGDLIIADPKSGELLAVVSIRDDRTDALSIINAPYEPGSTLKPFTVAALLQHGRVELEDTVDAEMGYWIAPDNRPLTDTHGEGLITIADAVRVSSNIGVAKAAQNLTPNEQYEALRDFGFGMPTGVGLPGEVGGMLRHPKDWTRRSPVSHAIGYEASVTPLQMTMAWGALANGGTLMKPLLVHGASDGLGRVVTKGKAESIRRVTRRDVTEQLTEVLVDVVEDGTGTKVKLDGFRVAGKSGTSRAFSEKEGSYVAGDYYSSFVGFFPADDPQLVVYVKLDRPRGEQYYGGAIAGPVTRRALEAILATRNAPLDRRALVEQELRSPTETTAEPAARVVHSADPSIQMASMDLLAEIDHLRARGAEIAADPDTGEGHSRPLVHDFSLPDVGDLPLRVAARRLHAFGLRVRFEFGDGSLRTTPDAGAKVSPGDTIVLRGASTPGLRYGRSQPDPDSRDQISGRRTDAGATETRQ